MVEEMTCHLAEKFCGGLKIEHKDEEGNVTRTIDLTRPWKRASYHDLIKGVAGDDFFDITAEQRRAKCEALGIQLSDNMEDYEVIQQVFEKKWRNTRSIPASSPASQASSCLSPKSPPAAEPSRFTNSSSTVRKFPVLLRTQRSRCPKRSPRTPSRRRRRTKGRLRFHRNPRTRHATRRRHRHRHRPLGHDANRRTDDSRRRAFPAVEEEGLRIQSLQAHRGTIRQPRATP